MSDEKPLSKSDENPSAQKNEIKPVSADAKDSDLAEDNPVMEEAAIPESNPEEPDNATPEESPHTPNQSEELASEAIADELETPFQGDVPPENEIFTAAEMPENELLQQVKSIGEANSELLRQLVKDFEVKLKYDTAKQEQIDKLYKENLEYKEGILDKFKRSLILAVIEQIDSAEKSIKFFGDKECSEENYRKLLNNFRDVVSEWQEMLLQQFDVSSYQCEPNSPVDVKRQRTLKQIPTEDATLYKHVRQTLRPGYELNEQVLRPEFVEVYVRQ